MVARDTEEAHSRWDRAFRYSKGNLVQHQMDMLSRLEEDKVLQLQEDRVLQWGKDRVLQWGEDMVPQWREDWLLQSEERRENRMLQW